MTDCCYYECFESKWLCLFVIDVSASMGKESLDRLNRELYDFQSKVLEDETSKESFEVSIITFSQDVKVLQEPSSVGNLTMPLLKTYDIDAIAKALNIAIEKIEHRKCWYKSTGQSFLRPCLVLVTSESFDQQIHSAPFTKLRQEIEAGKYELLNYSMKGASVFYEKYGSSIIEGKETIFQTMHYIHNRDFYRDTALDETFEKQ